MLVSSIRMGCQQPLTDFVFDNLDNHLNPCYATQKPHSQAPKHPFTEGVSSSVADTKIRTKHRKFCLKFTYMFENNKRHPFLKNEGWRYKLYSSISIPTPQIPEDAFILIIAVK